MAAFGIGIDLGGTKMLGILFDESMQSIDEIKVKTPGTSKGDEIRDLLINITRELLGRNKLSGEELKFLGVAVPGAVNWSKGTVLDTPNIGFKNYPLRTHLSTEFPNASVIVENDVNAGLYGELRLGCAKGVQNAVALFPGTGLGGALLLNGELFRGSRGAAGEIGHIRVQDGGRLCGCGRYGCLETLASKTALAKDLVALAATGRAPTIAAEGGTDFTKIRSGLIKKSVKAGEAPVIELVDRLAYWLGIGMANASSIFDPDAIVLGGGLIEKLGSEIVPKAEHSMRNHGHPSIVKHVKVVVSTLGDHAVATGAAVLASEAAKSRTNKKISTKVD